MLYLNYKLKSKSIPLVVIFLLLVDFGIIFIYLTDNLAGKPFEIVTRLFDLDSEISISTWYSSIQYFCIFILSTLFCFYQIKRDTKNLYLLALPAIFFLMSADEIVQMHEWLGVKSDYWFSMGNRRATPFPMTGIWVFVLGLPFITFFLFYTYTLKKYFSVNQSSINKLIIGMIIMLTGALGFELLSNFIDVRYWFIEVVFEEGLEMIGATIMFWAVYELVKDCYLIKEQNLNINHINYKQDSEL